MSLNMRAQVCFYTALFLLATAIGIYFGEGFLDRGMFQILAISQIIAFFAATILIHRGGSRYMVAQHVLALLSALIAYQAGHAWLIGFILGFCGFWTWMFLQTSLRIEASSLFQSLKPASGWASQLAWLFMGGGVSFAVARYFYPEDLPTMFLFASAFMILILPSSFAFVASVFRVQAASELMKRSIFVKDPEAFERMSEISVIAFDKTGTLTEGKPSVSQMVSIENVSHRDLLIYASALEKGIDHPYADAILQKAEIEKLPTLAIKDRVFEGGKGVVAQVQWENKWQEVAFGNLTWMYEQGIEPQEVPDNIRWEADGSDQTTLWLSVDKKIIGAIFLQDQLRKDSTEAVRALAEDGYEVGMITGDHENVSKKIGKALQLKFSHYGVVPKEKITIIKRLSEKKKKGFDFLFPKVAFIGDARNEGPALKEAYLGIALGSPEQVKDSPGAVATTSDKISAIPELFSLLRQSEWRANLSKVSLYFYHVAAAGGLVYLAWSKQFRSEWVALFAILPAVIQIIFAITGRVTKQA